MGHDNHNLQLTILLNALLRTIIPFGILDQQTSHLRAPHCSSKYFMFSLEFDLLTLGEGSAFAPGGFLDDVWIMLNQNLHRMLTHVISQ